MSEPVEELQLKAYSNGLKVSKLDMKYAKRQIGLVGKKQNVLDIGCSSGKLTSLIALNNKVAGIELCPNAVKKARRKGLNVKIGKVQKIPFPDNTFDAVHFSEIIEHILDTDKALKEIYRVLKPKGRLIVTTPNFCCFRDRILVLFGHLQGCARHKEHVKFFNKQRLKKYLNQNGFKVLGTYGSGFSVPYFPDHALTLFFMDKILPASLLDRLIMVAEKDEKRGLI
ncbi:MAG: class I SAM-dependent methyltransferase [Nanoarchaeota archaeon]|nr:class I SAM-dependent methyltransferase [Nanoarchaeota archaeon]